jgi:hypothetical protein
MAAITVDAPGLINQSRAEFHLRIRLKDGGLTLT